MHYLVFGICAGIMFEQRWPPDESANLRKVLELKYTEAALEWRNGTLPISQVLQCVERLGPSPAYTFELQTKLEAMA